MKVIIIENFIYKIPNSLFLKIEAADNLYREFESVDCLSNSDEIKKKERTVALNKIRYEIIAKYNSTHIDAHYAT